MTDSERIVALERRVKELESRAPAPWIGYSPPLYGSRPYTPAPTAPVNPGWYQPWIVYCQGSNYDAT